MIRRSVGNFTNAICCVSIRRHRHTYVTFIKLTVPFNLLRLACSKGLAWFKVFMGSCFYFERQAEVPYVTRIRQIFQPVKWGSGGLPLLMFALRLKHLAAGRNETNNLPFKRRGRDYGGVSITGNVVLRRHSAWKHISKLFT